MADRQTSDDKKSNGHKGYVESAASKYKRQKTNLRDWVVQGSTIRLELPRSVANGMEKPFITFLHLENGRFKVIGHFCEHLAGRDRHVTADSLVRFLIVVMQAAGNHYNPKYTIFSKDKNNSFVYASYAKERWGTLITHHSEAGVFHVNVQKWYSNFVEKLLLPCLISDDGDWSVQND